MACKICGSGSQPEYLFTTRAYYSFRDDFKVGLCRECGVRMVMDPPADLASYYADESVSGRKSAFYSWIKCLLLSREADRIRAGLEGVNTVLDLGCGDGEFALALSRKGWRVTAAGAQQDPPELLKGHKEISYIKVDFMDIIRSIPGDRVPRVIVMRHVLEHVREPVQLLKALISRGAECFYIAVPDHGHLLDRWLGKYFCAYAVPAHLWFFNRNALFRSMDKAGLEGIAEGPDTVPMVCSSFFCYLYLNNYPSWFMNFFKGGSPLNMLSFLLDLIVPGNVRWCFVKKACS